jgi:hypothetical protein
MPRMYSITVLSVFAVFIPFSIPESAFGDGLKDNIPDNVRPIPPAGIELPAKASAELLAGATALTKQIESLRQSLRKQPDLLALLPDVEIYAKAVDWSVRYNQIYRKSEIDVARELLKQGLARAQKLGQGLAPWLTQTGLVVRGYRSKIDSSVQPYGLVIPPGFVPGGTPLRLDFWFHGRGEKLSELSFINGRQRTAGQFTPPNTIVLHPYGRYSCANKLAGEMDLFEALDHAKKYYPIDDERIAVRGFSMGGAACWQFAVHYPGKWFAATPGAGFSETPEFLRFFQDEELKPTWYERKLWHLYDCTDYAVNLYNLPTIAYSGEIDRQKQAADIMADYLKKEGMSLTHLIGPGMGHKYHPDAKIEIERRLKSLAERGRNPLPRTVKFATYTLRYNESHWVRFDALAKHWDRAEIETSLDADKNLLTATTKGVTALTFSIPSGRAPFAPDRRPTIVIDGSKITGSPVGTDLSWTTHLRQQNGKWQTVSSLDTSGFTKRHGLQGPIDDAFMGSFLFVRPTGKAANAAIQKWSLGEMERARKHWQLQFRGIARIKDDKDITEADIRDHNLILWGDPRSNLLLSKLASNLPIQWAADEITAGTGKFNAANHALIAIHPNPLNPKRYIVLNSGFTYREYAYLNNARQIPMLPDWAVVDLRTPPGTQSPGRIADAGFFGEQWELSRVD